MRALQAKIVSTEQREAGDYHRVITILLSGRNKSKAVQKVLAFLLVRIQVFPQLLNIRPLEVVYRHLQLFLIAHIAIENGLPARRIARPHDVINAIDVLQERSDALQTKGQLGADGIEIDAAALLEVGELRDLEAIEHHLPAHAPCRQRRRLPVILFELDVVFAQIDAESLKRFEVQLLHIVRRRLQDYLKLHMLVEAVGIVAVASVGGAAGRLNVSYLVRLGTKHTEKRFRGHGAGADFDIIRLLQNAAALRPELLQAKDHFLKCRRGGVRHSKLLI